MWKHLYLCFAIWHNARTIRSLNAELSGKKSRRSNTTLLLAVIAILICVMLIETLTST